MTDPSHPPTPHVHAPNEVPRRLRAALALLALLVACAFGMLLWLWLGPLHSGAVQRHRLACQVQQLGGEPVGGVHCPPTETPHPHPDRRTPSPHLTADPTSTVVVVRPSSTRGQPRTLTPSSRSAPRRTHHRRHHHHRPRPPSHEPTPLACVTAGPVHACLNKPGGTP